MLRPKALREGDFVAVVAWSGGLEKDEVPLFERGVETLERMGFVVRVSPLVDLDRRWWWATALPTEVAEELNRNLRDPEVHAIFFLTGGRVTLSYLDLIDLETVRTIRSRCSASTTSPRCTCPSTPAPAHVGSGSCVSRPGPAPAPGRHHVDCTICAPRTRECVSSAGKVFRRRQVVAHR